MGKVLVSASHFDTLCKQAWELLEANGHEVIFDPSRSFPAYSHEELAEIIPDIDAAIIGMDFYNEEVFKMAPKLKCVCKFGVGVDNVNLDDATKYGVKVCNCPGQNSNAVAELTVGFIIAVLRGIIPLHKAMEQSKWPRYMGEELEGKTVGLLGFGADGRGLELLSDLPLEPFGVDPRPGHGAGGKGRGERQVFPVLLEKGIDLIVLGLCPKGNLADLVQAFLFPFVKPHPEGGLEGDGEGGNCRFHLGSSFLGSYGEGTTKEAGY